MIFFICKQKVRSLAREVYNNHFKAAQAVPRGVVANLCDIMKKLETASEKQWNSSKVS